MFFKREIDVKMHVLLNSELQEHLKLLKFFSGLPKDLREHVQTFYRSTLPMLLCPECGTGYYKLFEEKDNSPMTNCFMCCHNYYQLKFQMPSPVTSDVSDVSDISELSGGFEIS